MLDKINEIKADFEGKLKANEALKVILDNIDFFISTQGGLAKTNLILSFDSLNISKIINLLNLFDQQLENLTDRESSIKYEELFYTLLSDIKEKKENGLRLLSELLSDPLSSELCCFLLSEETERILNLYKKQSGNDLKPAETFKEKKLDKKALEEKILQIKATLSKESRASIKAAFSFILEMRLFFEESFSKDFSEWLDDTSKETRDNVFKFSKELLQALKYATPINMIAVTFQNAIICYKHILLTKDEILREQMLLSFLIKNPAVADIYNESNQKLLHSIREAWERFKERKGYGYSWREKLFKKPENIVMLTAASFCKALNPKAVTNQFSSIDNRENSKPLFFDFTPS